MLFLKFDYEDERSYVPQVDATKRGGIARFINHSCEVIIWLFLGGWHFIYFLLINSYFSA